MAHGVMECQDQEEQNSVCASAAAGAGVSSQPRGMGSRRIFAPQFKLQVLDSYRQDADCKGNQRATARKYGIHRRQIQKWLQSEIQLRSITAGGAGSPQGSPLGCHGSPHGSPQASPRPLYSPQPQPASPAYSGHGSASAGACSPAPSCAPSCAPSPPVGAGAGAGLPGLPGLPLSALPLPGLPVPSVLPLSGAKLASLGSLPLGVGVGPLGPVPVSVSAALNLSCESACASAAARLLGAGASPCQSVPVSVSVSPRSRSRSPTPAEARGVPCPVSVPGPVSPTLPIKKRWCAESETASSPPGSIGDEDHLEHDLDDDDEDIDVDGDIDGDGTESEASGASGATALDYTSATLSKRRSFSLQFKLEVLDAFRGSRGSGDALCQGNQRATARAFGINRRQVQKWLGQEPELREEAVSRGGLNRQRLGRWMEQEQEQDQDLDVEVADRDGCLDLSRKRRSDDSDHSDDSEVESKKMRLSPALSPAVSARLSPAIPTPAGPATATKPLQAVPSGPIPHPLAPHHLLFRPQPLNLPYLPLGLPGLGTMPFSMCEKRYSLDLKMGAVDLYAPQNWLKPEDFIKHRSSFLLNSFR